MKNLIVVLFAIVAFSFGINAQDLSFKTFNQTIKPKGELFTTFEAPNTKRFVFNEWGEYEFTQWFVDYVDFGPERKEVVGISKLKIFYDEIDFKYGMPIQIEKEYGDFKNVTTIKIQTNQLKRVALLTKYSETDIEESASSIRFFEAKTDAQAKSLVEKLKEKAFDMSLDLDAKVERVTIGRNEMRYNEEYPDGITLAKLYEIREAQRAAENTTETESKVADDEEDKPTTTTNTNSSNNSASNNSAPKEKTEIWVKLWNKSDGEIDISYESRGAGGSKTQTSINRRSTKGVRMKVGGRVFGANGAVLLTVTAAMDDTEQVIFK